MIIEKNTNTYNERRYGNPWIALVDFTNNSKGDFQFGEWIGQKGEAGVLKIDVLPGDIVAEGQKDYRNPKNSVPVFYLVDRNGDLMPLDSKADAYQEWKKNHYSDAPSRDALLTRRNALIAELEKLNELLSMDGD